MTTEERIKLFETELGYITDDNIRQFVEKAISILPPYFFEVPASSSGKFHSALESGFGGLVYHTKLLPRLPIMLLILISIKTNFRMTNIIALLRQRYCMIV